MQMTDFCIQTLFVGGSFSIYFKRNSFVKYTNKNTLLEKGDEFNDEKYFYWCEKKQTRQ